MSAASQAQASSSSAGSSRPTYSSFSAPPSMAGPSSSTNTTITSQSSQATAQPPAQQQQQPQSPPLQSTLPSADQQRYVAEARAAVVASMENMMDSSLHWRATTLHANAAQLKKQATDVQKATDGLRRERERLAREADAAARRVKELGNVQNWAEVLERDFLVLEETVRLADEGSECSCSCSECGGSDDGRGKDVVMEDAPGEGTWSDASRSLTEQASSTGTGRAKSNDTASVSTSG